MTDRKVAALIRAVAKLRTDLERVEQLVTELAEDAPANVAEMLDTAAAARAAGVAVSTWTTYASIGQGPTPDAHVSGRPLWRPDTVQAWKLARQQPRPRRSRSRG